MPFERIPLPLPGLAAMAEDFEFPTAMNAVVGWLFAVTGPLAILFAAIATAGLAPDVVASWIFGCYAIGGVLSIVMSLLYRQPLAMAWSIPAALLAGPPLARLGLPAVAGAYLSAGLAITLIGLSGGLARAMRYIPPPILMGMVCGVFLPFALKIVTGLQADPVPSAGIAAGFVAASAVPRIGRVVPPLLLALLAGLAVLAATGQLSASAPLALGIVRPVLVAPAFSLQAQTELVVPLIITVIGIQNAQGFAVLAQSGYRPPVNAATVASGLGSLAAAAVGAGPSCVAGPSNALLCIDGTPHRRYVGGVAYGVLMLAFGIAAPMAAALGHILPPAFIGVLGGFAILRPLQGWMTSAFHGPFSLGAVVAFIVTLSGAVVLHISAPFWGIVAGLLASLTLERRELLQTWRPASPAGASA